MQRKADRSKEWPVYPDEDAREQEQVENVFGLGGGELRDEPFAGYLYNYDDYPEWASRDFDEPDHQYHTVIVSGGGYLPSPDETLEHEGVEWRLADFFMNSGESDCWVCGAGTGSAFADGFFDAHGREPRGDDECGLCETPFGDQPGSIYIGEGYEAVYMTHNRNIWPEDYDEPELDPRGASTMKKTAAGISREEFEDMREDLPDGMTYEDFLDDPAARLLDDPQSGGDPDDDDLNEAWLSEALELVQTQSPVNIKDFGYGGELDENWAYTVSHHRDSETIDQSNFEVIQQDLEARFPNDVVVEEASHWAVGWIEHLAVRVLDDRGRVTDAGVAILEWLEKLQDYPVADEDHWSEKQYELAAEYIDRDIKDILESDDDIGDVTEEDVSNVWEWLRHHAPQGPEHVEEYPEQHGLDDYADDVLDAARALKLDTFSRNLSTIKKVVTQLVNQTELDAEGVAEAAEQQLDELEIYLGEYGLDQLFELAEAVINQGNPRQQDLPLKGAKVNTMKRNAKLTKREWDMLTGDQKDIPMWDSRVIHHLNYQDAYHGEADTMEYMAAKIADLSETNFGDEIIADLQLDVEPYHEGDDLHEYWEDIQQGMAAAGIPTWRTSGLPAGQYDLGILGDEVGFIFHADEEDMYLLRENWMDEEYQRDAGVKTAARIADNFQRDDFEQFFDAYLETALWSSHDESDESGGEPMDANYDVNDIADECLEAMHADCQRFFNQHRDLVDDEIAKDAIPYGPDYGPWGHVGHDFWLTRNGHGAGFWDGDYSDDVGELLTESSEQFGEVDLYVGDDGQIYCQAG